MILCMSVVSFNRDKFLSLQINGIAWHLEFKLFVSRNESSITFPLFLLIHENVFSFLKKSTEKWYF